MKMRRKVSRGWRGKGRVCKVEIRKGSVGWRARRIV